MCPLNLRILRPTPPGPNETRERRADRYREARGGAISRGKREPPPPACLLTCHCPPCLQIPLFKDAFERTVIPQVPLFQLLSKFNGEALHDDVRLGRRRYRLARLPDYLVLHVRRFNKNNFFWEKNPSIVNFPVKGLDLQARHGGRGREGGGGR